MKASLSILCSLLFVSAAMADAVTVMVKPEKETKSVDRVKEVYTTVHWLKLCALASPLS